MRDSAVSNSEFISTSDWIGTIATYDKNDPTAATPETTRKAQAVCETYLSQLHSSQDLANLRIGIPQVTIQSLQST